RVGLLPTRLGHARHPPASPTRRSSDLVVTERTATLARAAGLDPEAFLGRNDSHGFFAAAAPHLPPGEGLVVTEPTHTNAMDVYVGHVRQGYGQASPSASASYRATVVWKTGCRRSITVTSTPSSSSAMSARPRSAPSLDGYSAAKRARASVVCSSAYARIHTRTKPGTRSGGAGGASRPALPEAKRR